MIYVNHLTLQYTSRTRVASTIYKLPWVFNKFSNTFDEHNDGKLLENICQDLSLNNRLSPIVTVNV